MSAYTKFLDRLLAAGRLGLDSSGADSLQNNFTDPHHTCARRLASADIARFKAENGMYAGHGIHPTTVSRMSSSLVMCRMEQRAAYSAKPSGSKFRPTSTVLFITKAMSWLVMS